MKWLTSPVAPASLLLAFVSTAHALIRFHCAQLVTERLDPLVTPGIVSPHLHQVIGGVRRFDFITAFSELPS
ncbi:hypothetical protein FA13DRAFT_1634758 [Coprinellus micaceus]|uniref:DUF1996 domain-containing protein n=1 Tax=Coprinellus micaceus TaxID=71717 RepID=A0A4Y7SZJ8_COPMI|nr:hypothetical protein FA13DRAFT_1634758 [Coprinellus micaceus]